MEIAKKYIELHEMCQAYAIHDSGKMEWISVKEKTPSRDLIGEKILLIVNGQIQLGSVIADGMTMNNHFRFIFDTYSRKWLSDDRYAEPTHWMSIPQVPKE